MGKSNKKAKAPAVATAAPAAAGLVTPDDLIGRVDHWVGICCQPSLSIIGYTPVSALHQHFVRWHEAVYPDDATPTDKQFGEALKGRLRIRFEHMPVREPFERPRIAMCVNLTLLEPIEEAA